MYKDLYTLRKGFTLIEVLISMAFIVIILSLLLSTFQFQYDTYENLYDATSGVDNLRFLSSTIETQIRATPTIYVLNNCVYLKDLETPEYLNYYTLSNGMVFKTKVDKYLDSIGLGSTSQISEKLDAFILTCTDNGKVKLVLTSTVSGKTYQVVKEVAFLGKVIVIRN